MINVKCIDSFDFGIHFAGEHIKNHFVIADERPKRIFESRRFVVFDKEMRKPGKNITDNETKRKIKPIFGSHNPHQQDNAKHCADKMQIAR